MPEGHSVHRIALQLTADFVGHEVAVSSPQGRFATGAALLDGATMTEARAVGKHLLVSFEQTGAVAGVRWLRVHLGLYGAWDFHGRISATTQGAASGSIGAPRLRRAVRMGEDDRTLGAEQPPPFPPEPVGQVRLRLRTEESLADLRGPTACEVITPDDVVALLAAAGPDPRVDAWPDAEGTFVQRLTSRGVAVGQLLMDQAVVSGIGNIYRAEMLFRAGLDPHTPGKRVPAEVARELWRDWVRLLDDGVRTGLMLTRIELTPVAVDSEDTGTGRAGTGRAGTGRGGTEQARASGTEQARASGAELEDAGSNAADRTAAIADPSLRHAVYGRAGEPCYVCGTPIQLEDMAARKLYWCPTCQT